MQEILKKVDEPVIKIALYELIYPSRLCRIKVCSKTTFGLQHFSFCSAWDRSSGGRGLGTGGGLQLQPLPPPEPRDDSSTLLRESPDRWVEEQVALYGS